MFTSVPFAAQLVSGGTANDFFILCFVFIDGMGHLCCWRGGGGGIRTPFVSLRTPCWKFLSTGQHYSNHFVRLSVLPPKSVRQHFCFDTITQIVFIVQLSSFVQRFFKTRGRSL